MIAVDTNLIAYLFVKGDHSGAAERVYRKDPDWAAPLLWRCEIRSVLVRCLRTGFFDLGTALSIIHEAELLMSGGEYAVVSSDVLKLAVDKGCSACDAEFVSLALELGVPFVTLDKKILEQFPETAMSPDRFTAL